MSDVSAKKRRSSKFAEILRDYENTENERLFEEPVEEHVFSEYFENVMLQLFYVAEKKQKKYFYIWHKAYYKVAFIIFCILIALVGSSVVYATVKLVNMYVVDFGEGSEINYDIDGTVEKTIPSRIDNVFTPSWIPEGYEEVDAGYNELTTRISYINEIGDKITFRQTILSEKGEIINTEGAEVVHFKVKNYDAIYCNNKGMTMMVWWDGSYNYTITAGNLTREDAERIANSLEEKTVIEK